MTDVSITEIARHFSDYINRVSYKGERFTILRNNKPVAEIAPVPAGRTLGDLVRILAEIAPLPADEAAAFEKDLAEIRRNANEETLGDPWASS